MGRGTCTYLYEAYTHVTLYNINSLLRSTPFIYSMILLLLIFLTDIIAIARIISPLSLIERRVTIVGNARVQHRERRYNSSREERARRNFDHFDSPTIPRGFVCETVLDRHRRLEHNDEIRRGAESVASFHPVATSIAELVKKKCRV